MPGVLVAPDSFKGTLTASDVAEALAGGFESVGWSADRCPLADGGEGTGEVLMDALGGETVPIEASDPLGRPVDAVYRSLGDGATAVVEVAEASGLGRLADDELDPLATTSRGTGELIVSAAREAAVVLVAVGGSATNDGGLGALAAISEAGGLGDTRLVCLCDVTTPWEHASRVFGPQKGADRSAVAKLEARLDRLAAELPRDPRGVPRSGAAGGLAGGLWAALGASLEHGASYVCDAVGIDERIDRADLVIGGEGRLDETTLEGKVLAELSDRCAQAGKPLVAVVGQDASGPELRARLGLSSVVEACDATGLRAAALSLAG
ncbi:MAG: glycerate kinase [Solirubrobacterales bacterium]